MTTLSWQQPTHPPPPLEVRCAGCGETLELDPGMIEFICPDCHTPQTLPPELMPRKRKALPLPRGIDSSKIQLPCGSCSSLLNVPQGLARFFCPKCGVELAVDQEKLKGYLAGSSVAAAEVAIVMPSAVRLPLAVDVVPQIQDQSPVSSRALVSSTINPYNNHTSIPFSMAPVPCHLNTHQTEKEQETAPTPPHKTKEIKKGKLQMGPTTKEIEAEQEEEASPYTTKTKPKKKENNRNKKQSSGPTTKEIEISLRRSKRIVAQTSSAPTKKHKTQSQNQPSQSQPSQSQQSQSEDNESSPLDIARHYNNLLSDPVSPNLQGDLNNNTNDDDEANVVGSDSSQSEPELESYREPESESVLQKALRDAQKRRGLIPGSRKSTKSTPGKRGPSKCLEIWERADDEDLIEVEFNSSGQPIGEQASALIHFLGSISRDGKLVPLNYTEWKNVPVKYKDIVWYIVKSKFKVEENNRRYLMKAVSRDWTYWRSRLKKLHYDSHDNDEARLADIDARIEPEQWPFLVQFWGSEESKKRCAIAKANGSKQKSFHATGSKSFARIREEERLKRENKEEPSPAEIFILTHTRKDGTPVDEESAQIIEQLRDELKKAEASNNKIQKDNILANVLGKKKHTRAYGLLPNKPGPKESEEPAQVVSETNEETKAMKDKMEAMERRHKEMEMEMGLMRKTMLAMQTGSVPPGFWGNLQGGDVECVPSDRDTSSSR